MNEEVNPYLYIDFSKRRNKAKLTKKYFFNIHDESHISCVEYKHALGVQNALKLKH